MDEKKNNLKTTKPNPKVRPIFWLVSIILIVFLGYLAFPNKLGQRGPRYASRAKSTLRSTGSSQLAYQLENDLKSYGSFQDLVNSLYIADGYTQGNLIEGYSVSWEISSSQPVLSGNSGTFDQFTIIAVPTLDLKFLKTFAITEDQHIRAYEPGHGNDFNSVKTWDPIF